jgi:2-aminoethylphosphonate aminotransferase
VLLNPGPATTTDSVKYAQVVPDICPREKEFGSLIQDIRKKLVKVVNGQGRYTSILFASSGTGVMEACISSAVPDNKKIFIINNGAYGKRMVEIAERFYSKERLVTYEMPFGDYPNIRVIEDRMKKDGDIAVVAVVHHETTTGMLNPVEEINRIAHAYGIHSIVDTISSYAGIPIDLQKDDYDFIISSANKCIQGMAGIAFVICKKEMLEITKDYQKRNFYFNLWQQYYFLENEGQMQFTPPVQVAYALNQALDEYFQETGEHRYRRYTEAWETLIEGLRRLNFSFLLPIEQQSRLLTAVIDPKDPNYSFDEMHDYLLERGFTIYPGKGAKEDTFRVTNIGAIDKRDIKSFLKALDTYIREKNISLK